MRAIFISLLLMAVPLAATPKMRVTHVPVWAGESELAAAPFDPTRFSAALDGSPAKVLGSLGPSDDLMVILALDFTGDLRMVELAKQAAVEAVRNLPQGATVAVLRAQDGMRVASDPTTDREAVERAIRDSPVSGAPGFLDTVEAACRIADRIVSRTRIRAAVIYLTDSSIYDYREDYANAVINRSDSHDMSRRFPEGRINEEISSLGSKLEPLQAPLFIVQLAYRSDRLERAYQSGQLQLAAATGGAAIFCASSAEIADAISSTFADVASHYVLELQIPAVHARAMQLRVENGDRPLNYRERLVLP